MGVAVMERASIFDCQMKAFHATWSTKKRQAILTTIERYVTHYSVVHVAIKVPTFSVSAPAVLEVLEDIKKLCNEKGISVDTYSLPELKKRWLGTSRGNKIELMRRILEKQPELQREYNKEGKNKVKYYEKLFEAVAVCELVLKN
jgi:hypothetical protein